MSMGVPTNMTELRLFYVMRSIRKSSQIVNVHSKKLINENISEK